MKKTFDRINIRRFSKTQLLALGASIIFLLSSLNAIYYSIRFAFGSETGTYIFHGDLFADLFKVIFSYPYASQVVESDYSHLPSFLKSYIDNNPYNGFEGLARGELTHFHLPPLTTAISFILIKLFSLLGFLSFSIILFTTSFLLLSLILKIAFKNSKYIDVILLLLIASYPLLFIIQRGNFFSFFATLATILSIIALRRSYVVISMIFIAMAINVRPNLLVFLPIFYFIPSKNIFRPGLLLIFTIAVFAASLYSVNFYYPDYSVDSFLTGLSIYKSMYVYGDGGFAYNASLYSFLKYIFKLINLSIPLNTLLPIVTVISLLALLFFTFIYKKLTITLGEFVLLLTTIGMLSTHVFGDYHLLIFALPILLIIDSWDTSNINSNTDLKHKMKMFLFCILMLSPVNYYQSKGIYIAPFIKTIAAIWISIYIPIYAYKREVNASIIPVRDNNDPADLTR